MRGTPEAYSRINPNDDTLYFISESDSSEALLYLGTKKIGDSSIDFNTFSLDTLKDVLISEKLTDRSILMYSVENQNWINVDFDDLTFVGATSKSNGIGGFVPAPAQGQTNLFLRSDGQWVAIPAENQQNQQSPDKISLDIYNNQLALKNYGIKYYKYNEITKDYQIQIVNDTNPWKENLVPKVIEENGQLVLGWFEEIYEQQIKNLASNLDVVFGLIGNPKTENQGSSGIFAELDKKANINDIFTKQEIKKEIDEAIAKSSHLKRLIVSSIDEIDLTKDDVDLYIYLIPINSEIEKNKYDEYLVVQTTSGVKTLEKIGSYETDLSDYYTKKEIINILDKKVDKIDGARLITKEEGTKLNSLLNIQSIDSSLVLENNQLSIGEIPSEKVNNLNNLISSVSEVIQKLDTISLGAEKNYISSVSNQFSVQNGQLSLNSISISNVTDLETILNNKVDKEEISSLEKDIENIKSILTWSTI